MSEGCKISKSTHRMERVTYGRGDVAKWFINASSLFLPLEKAFALIFARLLLGEEPTLTLGRS
jgi:hypothetical protein